MEELGAYAVVQSGDGRPPAERGRDPAARRRRRAARPARQGRRRRTLLHRHRVHRRRSWCRSTTTTACCDVDRDARTVTVQAGIRLGDLNEALAREGLAMSQPRRHRVPVDRRSDLDRYTRNRTRLRQPRDVRHELTLVLRRRERPAVLACDRRDDVQGGAGRHRRPRDHLDGHVALRAGVQPARRRGRDEARRRARLAWTSSSTRNEHFEFYWFPHTDRAWTKQNNRTTDDPTPRRRVEGVPERHHHVEPRVRRDLPRRPVRARADPGSDAQGRRAGGRTDPSCRRAATSSTRARGSSGSPRWSTRSRASTRARRSRGSSKLIEANGFNINFPIEVRVVAPDDILLSPAHGRETCYIAVHLYQGMDYEPYFRAVEELMMSLRRTSALGQAPLPGRVEPASGVSAVRRLRRGAQHARPAAALHERVSRPRPGRVSVAAPTRTSPPRSTRSRTSSRSRASDRFRYLAYRRAAEAIETTARSVCAMRDRRARRDQRRRQGHGRAGEGVLRHRARSTRSTTLRAQVPIGLREMTLAPGTRTEAAMQLYQAIGVSNLDELRVAAEENRIARGEGLRREVRAGRARRDRARRAGDAARAPRARAARRHWRCSVSSSGMHAVERARTPGRCAACRETIGDIDLLVAS